MHGWWNVGMCGDRARDSLPARPTVWPKRLLGHRPNGAATPSSFQRQRATSAGAAPHWAGQRAAELFIVRRGLSCAPYSAFWGPGDGVGQLLAGYSTSAAPATPPALPRGSPRFNRPWHSTIGSRLQTPEGPDPPTLEGLPVCMPHFPKDEQFHWGRVGRPAARRRGAVRRCGGEGCSPPRVPGWGLFLSPWSRLTNDSSNRGHGQRPEGSFVQFCRKAAWRPARRACCGGARQKLVQPIVTLPPNPVRPRSSPLHAAF